MRSATIPTEVLRECAAQGRAVADADVESSSKANVVAVALFVRERLSAALLPSAADEVALATLSDGASQAPSADAVLWDLLSPERSVRRDAFAAAERLAAPPSTQLCVELLARAKPDCGAHALARFAANARVCRALLDTVRREWHESNEAQAQAQQLHNVVRLAASDAYSALAAAIIAGLWFAAGDLALLLCNADDVEGCGVLAGLDACSELLLRGEERAEQRAEHAAQLGDVRTEKAWRDQAAMLTAAQATFKASY